LPFGAESIRDQPDFSTYERQPVIDEKLGVFFREIVGRLDNKNLERRVDASAAFSCQWHISKSIAVRNFSS